MMYTVESWSNPEPIVFFWKHSLELFSPQLSWDNGLAVMLSMTKHFPKNEKKLSKIHIQTFWFSETFTTILSKIFSKYR